MNKSIVLVAATLFGLAAAARTASAQSVTSGAVAGVVTDKASGEAMAGVTVVASSPSLQGTQSAITEADGSYKITNLPPGVYQVVFYFGEIQVKRTDVQVTINRTMPVYVKIDQTQTGGEVIEIKGAPNIDTTSTTQGITLGEDYHKNIPVPGRDFTSQLGAAPGSSGDDLGVSFSGSTSLENSYVVDGVNTTGLSYGTVGSSIYNGFIQEIEIITGGYQAEYGRSTGGVVNVVTKQGSNEFHGDVETQFTNDFLAKNPTRNPSQSSTIEASPYLAYDLTTSFDLGGPVIKDKLWFYVGFAPRLIRTNIDRITKTMTDCHQIDPATGNIQVDSNGHPVCDQAFADGQPDLDDNGFFYTEDIPGGKTHLHTDQAEYQFVSKLNYAVSPEHQGQFSFTGIPATFQNDGVYGERAATSYNVTELTTDVATKWTSKFNNNKTEVEAVLGWHRDHLQAGSVDSSMDDVPRQTLLYGTLDVWSRRGYETPATAAACADGTASDKYPSIDNCPDLGLGYAIGGPGYVANDKENRYTAKLDGTQRIKALGNHEIKGGLDLEQNLMNKPRVISGNALYDSIIGNDITDLSPGFPTQFTEETRWVAVAPTGSSDPMYADYNDTCGADPNSPTGNPRRCKYLGPTDVEGNTLNWASFLQDSWQIMPNLTLNAGVRYEEQRLRYAKALQNSVDPFTLEPRGKDAMDMTGMWAPRLGALYDWTKEGRSKVYASYGRFYESIPMDINQRSFGGESLIVNRYSFSACGPTDDTLGAPTGQSCSAAGNPDQGQQLIGGAGVLVEPGIKPQYLDEIVVGTEYELMEDLKVGIAYQNRRLGRVIEDVSVDNAQTYILANPGEFDSGEESSLEDKISEKMASSDPADQAEATRLQTQLDMYRQIRNFDTPRRDYHALQLTALKRLSKNLFVQGSYTYSRVLGNYPGLYSADNGQVDPNISSEYDLIELLSNRNGPLPGDRPHYFKLDGYYTWDFDRLGKLTTGTRIRAESGRPFTALASHYLYGANESFLLPRDSRGRGDWDWSVDAHLGYARELSHGMEFEVFTDLFDLPTVFKTEGIYAVDETYTFQDANPVVGGEYRDLIWLKRRDPSTGAETADPVFRNANFGHPAARYTPFFAQLGARLTF